MRSWERTKAAAKADATLRAFAAAAREANRVRRGSVAEANAFRDRVDELGLYVPNAAYYGVLMGVCLPTD